jgi:hypothetical protein
MPFLGSLCCPWERPAKSSALLHATADESQPSEANFDASESRRKENGTAKSENSALSVKLGGITACGALQWCSDSRFIEAVHANWQLWQRVCGGRVTSAAPAADEFAHRTAQLGRPT